MARIEDIKVGDIITHKYWPKTERTVVSLYDKGGGETGVEVDGGERWGIIEYITVVKPAAPPVRPLFAGDSGWRA